MTQQREHWPLARVLAWIRDRGQRPFRRHQRGVKSATTAWTPARLRKIADAINRNELAPFDLNGRVVGIKEFEAAAYRPPRTPRPMTQSSRRKRRNDVTFDSAAVMGKWPKFEPRPLLTSVDLAAPTIPFMGAAVMLYLRRSGGEILVDPDDIERVRDEAPKALANLLDRRELTAEGKRDGVFENLLDCWHGADIYLPTDSFIVYGSSGWVDRPEGDTLAVGHGANAKTWTNVRLRTADVLALVGAKVGRPKRENTAALIAETTLQFQRELVAWKESGGAGKRPSVSGVATAVAVRHVAKHEIAATADRIRKAISKATPGLVRARIVE